MWHHSAGDVEDPYFDVELSHELSFDLGEVHRHVGVSVCLVVYVFFCVNASKLYWAKRFRVMHLATI